MHKEWKTVEYSASLVLLNHTLYLWGSGITVAEASGKIVRTGRTGCARCDSTIAYGAPSGCDCVHKIHTRANQSILAWDKSNEVPPLARVPLVIDGCWERESRLFAVCFSFFFFNDAALESTQVHQVDSVEIEMDLIKLYLSTSMKNFK